MQTIYFDTETTGLVPGQICQLAYIIVTDSGEFGKNFYFTCENMPIEATNIHGLTQELLVTLSGGDVFATHIDEICEDFRLADAVYCHNYQFDYYFMQAECSRCGRLFVCKNPICTMKKFTPICKLKRVGLVGYKYPKLSELVEHFQISKETIQSVSQRLFGRKMTRAHDATYDAVCVYLALQAYEREKA